MSTTTVTTSELRDVLSDYTIRLTGHGETNNPFTALTQNPPSWPTNHHRIPDYRPINYELDFALRPFGSHWGESTFLTVMFTGLWINASFARAWGATGGKLFPGLLSYSIGGEW